MAGGGGVGWGGGNEDAGDRAVSVGRTAVGRCRRRMEGREAGRPPNLTTSHPHKFLKKNLSHKEVNTHPPHLAEDDCLGHCLCHAVEDVACIQPREAAQALVVHLKVLDAAHLRAHMGGQEGYKSEKGEAGEGEGGAEERQGKQGKATFAAPTSQHMRQGQLQAACQQQKVSRATAAAAAATHLCDAAQLAAPKAAKAVAHLVHRTPKHALQPPGPGRQ